MRYYTNSEIREFIRCPQFGASDEIASRDLLDILKGSDKDESN